MQKRIIICIVISISLIISGVLLIRKSRSYIKEVSGTVIAKNSELYTSYKNTNIMCDLIIAVHPDNSDFYDFDICVPLHTYTKFKVGDKIIVEKDVSLLSKSFPIYKNSNTILLIATGLIIIGLFFTPFYFLIVALINDL